MTDNWRQWWPPVSVQPESTRSLLQIQRPHLRTCACWSRMAIWSDGKNSLDENCGICDTECCNETPPSCWRCPLAMSLVGAAAGGHGMRTRNSIAIRWRRSMGIVETGKFCVVLITKIIHNYFMYLLCLGFFFNLLLKSPPKQPDPLVSFAILCKEWVRIRHVLEDNGLSYHQTLILNSCWKCSSVTNCWFLCPNMLVPEVKYLLLDL